MARLILAALVIMAVMAAPTHAQLGAFVGAAGVFAGSEKTGGDVTMGMAFSFEGLTGSVQVGALGTHVGPATRYYRDEFDNGQSRCRDRNTGQFASDRHCSGSVRFDPIILGEATYAFGPVVLGFGARQELVPYAIAGLAFGDRYVAALRGLTLTAFAGADGGGARLSYLFGSESQ